MVKTAELTILNDKHSIKYFPDVGEFFIAKLDYYPDVRLFRRYYDLGMNVLLVGIDGEGTRYWTNATFENFNNIFKNARPVDRVEITVE